MLGFDAPGFQLFLFEAAFLVASYNIDAYLLSITFGYSLILDLFHLFLVTGFVFIPPCSYSSLGFICLIFLYLWVRNSVI